MPLETSKDKKYGFFNAKASPKASTSAAGGDGTYIQFLFGSIL